LGIDDFGLLIWGNALAEWILERTRQSTMINRQSTISNSPQRRKPVSRVELRAVSGQLGRTDGVDRGASALETARRLSRGKFDFVVEPAAQQSGNR
jgi:hypothetical protein